MTTTLTRRESEAPAMSGWENSAADNAMVPTEAGTVSAVAREEAELKAAIVVARRFPREEPSAYTRIIKSCERPSFAEGALYSFPRGGQQITGPSVDLAREMARCWGNIRFGLRVVTMDDDYCHVKGYAIDLETNNLVEAEDKFKKLVFRKNKGWVEPDERDLRELVNRRGAILVRNCILQIMPPDITDDAQRKARETLDKAAKGEFKQNKQDAIRRLVMAFDSLGVNTQMLSEKLGHSLDLLTEKELVDLRTVYKSINDGNSKREEHFKIAPVESSTGSARLNEKLTNRPVSSGQKFVPDPNAAANIAAQEAHAAEAAQDPAQHGEELDVSGAEAEPPEDDISTWSATVASCFDANANTAGEVNLSDDELKRRIGLWVVGNKLKTKEETSTREQRRSLIAAVAAGKLGSDGKIAQ